MFPALFSSLQVRFLLLLLLAVLPGLGLAFYLSFEHRQQFIARAQEEALQFVRVTTAHQERLIEAERQLLSTIAQLPEVLRGDSATCHIYASLPCSNNIHAMLTWRWSHRTATSHVMPCLSLPP